jgi:beta-lactamase regulating signal transducer with metallopeptidase domain
VERLSLLCFTAALLGLAIWGISIAQTVRGLTRSVRLIREFEIASHEIYLPGEPSPALVISHGPPIFAMCGIVHPRLVFSRDVQLALTAKEFDVTIRHERAHRNSGDNLKRLLLLLAPEISPFSRCFRDLEDAWVKMSEWAADDEATLGDPLAAIALAEAIIRVARLGVRAPSPICASLVADTSFSVRVVRLLQTERVAVSELSPQRPVRKTSIAVFGAALLIAAATLAINLWSPILYTLHRFLEQIAR